jgi:hypothetical protein
LRLIKRVGSGAPWAAWLSGKGLDDEMRRADQPFIHGRSGLESQQVIDQGLVETAAKLGEGFGQYTVGLRAVELDMFSATGMHHCPSSTQPLAKGFIGGAHCMFEPLQSQQHTRWNGVATAGGMFGETPGNALLDGLDHLRPGKCIAPLANGIGFGHHVGNPSAGAATAEPLLKVTYKTHCESSCWIGLGGLRIRRYAPHDNPLCSRD